MTVEEMRIEEIADKYAQDFFTRAPAYRSRKYLKFDIDEAIREFAGVPSKYKFRRKEPRKWD